MIDCTLYLMTFSRAMEATEYIYMYYIRKNWLDFENSKICVVQQQSSTQWIFPIINQQTWMHQQSTYSVQKPDLSIVHIRHQNAESFLKSLVSKIKLESQRSKGLTSAKISVVTICTPKESIRVWQKVNNLQHELEAETDSHA